MSLLDLRSLEEAAAGGAHDLAAVGAIPTAEAFDSASVVLVFSGLSAGEDATEVGGVTVSVSLADVGAVAGLEAFGPASLSVLVQTSAIAGEEAFGAADVAVSFAGLSAGDDATGVGGVTLSVSLAEVGGIASAEAFGEASAGVAQEHPAAAAAGGGGLVYRRSRRHTPPPEIVQEPLRLGPIQVAVPAGIQSEERFGDPAVTLGLLSAAHRRKAFLKFQTLSARL
jgi:hypothetical protein